MDLADYIILDGMKTIEEYILEHIDPEPELLKKIDRDTRAKRLYSNMLSGHLQGRLLVMITRMMNAKRVLEVGTFTGYSALCFAEGVTDDGEVHTIEVNDELEDLLRGHFSESEHGNKIHLYIGDATEVIPSFQEDCFDLAFLDADKEDYSNHYELILPKLRRGGVLLVDNTLWYSKVLEEVKKNDGATRAVQQFNNLLAKDERVEKVILPLRDGVTIIRKK